VGDLLDFEIHEGGITLWATSFVAGFIAGLVPAGLTTELYLTAVSSAAPASTSLAVAALTTVGHIGAKVVWYLAARGVLRVPLSRYQHRLEAARQRLTGWRYGTDAFVLLSSFASIPPHNLTCILAGLLKWPYTRFFAISFAGRFTRFALVVVFPQIAKSLM